MNDKESVLVALHDFEEQVKNRRLPCVIIVGLPDQNDFIRFSGGMDNEQNRALFKSTFLNYLADRAREAGSLPPLDGCDQILLERIRQQADEGWSAAWDDKYIYGELAKAGAAYANAEESEINRLPRIWPLPSAWWKPSPSDRVRELAKAGALIAAEMDRLLRAQARGGVS